MLFELVSLNYFCVWGPLYPLSCITRGSQRDRSLPDDILNTYLSIANECQELAAQGLLAEWSLS